MRPCYADAVSWIAANDYQSVALNTPLVHQASVVMVAELYGRSPEKVAADVQEWRRTLEALDRVPLAISA